MRAFALNSLVSRFQPRYLARPLRLLWLIDREQPIVVDYFSGFLRRHFSRRNVHLCAGEPSGFPRSVIDAKRPPGEYPNPMTIFVFEPGLIFIVRQFVFEVLSHQ